MNSLNLSVIEEVEGDAQPTAFFENTQSTFDWLHINIGTAWAVLDEDTDRVEISFNDETTKAYAMESLPPVNQSAFS